VTSPRTRPTGMSRPEDLRATGSANARPRWKMRQVFMAGPDYEQVEVPISLGALRITEGGRYR
jgi:hypothetical protein